MSSLALIRPPLRSATFSRKREKRIENLAASSFSRLREKVPAGG
jgi:hypothetical protein